MEKIANSLKFVGMCVGLYNCCQAMNN